jgi:hypothetical protein
VVAFGVIRALYPDIGPATAADVVMPHKAPVAGEHAGAR